MVSGQNMRGGKRRRGRLTHAEMRAAGFSTPPPDPNLKNRAVAISIVFVVYTIIGGAIFQKIEQPALAKECKDAEIRVNELLAPVICTHAGHAEAQLTANLSMFHLREIFDAHHVIEDIGAKMHLVRVNGSAFCRHAKLTKAPGYHAEIDCPIRKWDLVNSIMFSVVTITTLGYGNVSPSTVPGRLFCIVFALFGLPIFGFFVYYWTKVGKQVENSIYQKMGGGDPLFQSYKTKLLICLVQFAILIFFWFILVSFLFCHVDKWDYITALYYAFITLTTIGYGDYTPYAVWNTAETHKLAAEGNLTLGCIYVFAVCVWMLSGLVYLSVMLDKIADIMKLTVHKTSDRFKRPRAAGQPAVVGRSDSIL